MTPVASVVPVVALLVSFNVLPSRSRSGDPPPAVVWLPYAGVCVYMRACIQIAVR